MIVLFLSCLVVFIMIIWFKTDGIVEWADLLKIGFLLQTDKYRAAKIDAAPILLTYPNYLKTKHNNFISRMVGCPICLSVWLVILGSIISLTPFLFPITWTVSIILYGIINKLV